MNLKQQIEEITKHPTFHLLEAEASHFDYILEPDHEKNPTAFRVGDESFDKIVHIDRGVTADEFLEKQILPCFDRYATARATRNKIYGLDNAGSYYDKFKETFYKTLNDIKPTDYYECPDSKLLIPIYKDYDSLQSLWTAYETLENFALSLGDVCFMETHCDLNCTFKIYLEPDSPLTYAVTDARGLQQCFVMLSFAYFLELLDEDEFLKADDIVKQVLVPWLSDITDLDRVDFDVKFDCKERQIYCLMTSKHDIKFDCKEQPFHRLITSEQNCSFNCYPFERNAFRNLLDDLQHFKLMQKRLQKKSSTSTVSTQKNVQQVLIEFNNFLAKFSE